MGFMRRHWFDLGILWAVIVSGFLLTVKLQPLSLLLWISLISLFLHQFEEYRYPGYFPGMVNTVMFGSKKPDRYPLNTNTAFVVNVVVGWLSYFLAALHGAKAMWLAIATILVSAGNFVAHAFIFVLGSFDMLSMTHVIPVGLGGLIQGLVLARAFGKHALDKNAG